MEVEPIAIVGMSCRLPGGANSPEQLWDILQRGQNTWTDVPRDRFRWESFYHPNADQPNATNHRGGHFLDQDIAAFDAKFFGVAGHEAEAMDPQQRMLIELAYEALENAGITRESVRGSSMGVYTAIFNNDYQRILTRDVANFPKTFLTGNALAMLANKISYLLDLRGPSILIDTACSGSLVAIHQACQALRTYEIESAIAGAANLIIDPDVMTAMSDSHFLNGDGRSYSFDARGDGYGRGDGIGVVILKRLKDALRDGDTVRAVIRNTGLGQDGKTAGITLPSAEAQASLIESVYARAALDPRETAYVEAHGTGTIAGDYAELGTISKVFGGSNGSPTQQSVHVGSIKANIGHTESTSGVAGLIKSVLVLEKGIIPPNPPIEELKPNMLPEGSTVLIPQKAVPWPSDIRRASINSFGFGGTNAHCILESADYVDALCAPARLGAQDRARTEKVRTQTQFLLPISANSQESLNRTTENIKRWLETGTRSNASLRHLAYTLSSRRSKLVFRQGLIGRLVGSELSILDSKKRPAARAPISVNLTFVFTGQGAQWFAMGRELLGGSKVFTDSITRSDSVLRGLGASWSLMEELSREKSDSCVSDSRIGQPACTAIQVALVDLLAELDVRPSAVVGHSSGEIAAAYAAGVLSHESALNVSYHRSFLAKRCWSVTKHKGAMMVVGLGENEVHQHLTGLRSGKAVIACANSPSSTTVSGDEPAIAELFEILQGKDIFARRLQVDTAYHSHHMQAVAKSYLQAMGDIKVSSCRSDIKFFSSVTGEKKTESFSGAYWVENLVSKVRFYEAITATYLDATARDSSASQIFMEVGPHHALAGPTRDTLSKIAPKAQHPVCLPTLLRGVDALSSILESCGRLFEKGYEFAIDKLHCLDGTQERPKVITDLAPYEWDHSTRYWLEHRLSKAHRQRKHPQHELLGLRVPGTSPTEPVWQHFLNSANTPWLLEHVIDGYPIFPASGYITMAIEAEKQLCGERGILDNVVNYVLKDVVFVRPLTIPDSPATAEIQISFQRTKQTQDSSWEAFVVSSVTPDGVWSENATGLIMVELKPSAATKLQTDMENVLSTKAELTKLRMLQGEQLHSLPGEKLYDYMASKGNLYGPNFATVSQYHYKAKNAVGQLTLPDTARHMPSGFEQPYVIHPGPLDALLHTAIPLFFETSRAESVMAVELDKVVISAKGLDKAGTQLEFLTTLAPIAPSSAYLQVSAFTTNDEGEEELVFRIVGGKLKGTAGDDDTANNSTEYDQTYNICWHEDIELLPPGELDRQVPSAESPERKFKLLDQAALISMRSCLQEVPESLVVPQHRAFYRWMQKTVNLAESRESIDHLSNKDEAEILEQLELMDEESQIVLLAGKSLGDCLQGKVESLLLFGNGNMSVDESMIRCHYYLKEVIKSIAFKSPKLRILEIGAESDGVTKSLLDDICNEWYMGIELYHYTNTSSESFDRARETLKTHSSFMQFQELDVTQDPVKQGFIASDYDLIISSRSIHMASRIDDAVSSARSLLKPGGRLLLIEDTHLTTSSGMIHGCSGKYFGHTADDRTDSPLLSAGEWKDCLARNGFGGIEFSKDDFKGSAQRSTFMVAQAVGPTQTRDPTSVRMIVSPYSSTTHLDSVRGLANNLNIDGRPASIEMLPVKLLDDDTIYILADDHNAPILANAVEQEWSSITSILSHPNMKLVWMTCKEDSIPPTKCEYGLSLGLCRSARIENPSLKVVNINMAGATTLKDPGLYQQLAHIVQKCFIAGSTSEVNEYEIRLMNGKPLIPRIQPNKTFNGVVKRAAGFEEPELTPFHQDDRPLKLSVERPGLLDSMLFIDDERASDPLPPCEVEVSVAAFGVNFKDVMLAMGQLDESISMAGEFAGTVTAVGADFEHRFKIGDRVCGMYATPYASRARTHGDNMYHCPDSMGFSECASVPVAYATAYHCIVDLARLEPQQTILIHVAAGGVGQAAISIAKSIGAEIFVTAGTESKVNFLMEHFDIPEDHIFTSRSRLFKAGVMRMTQNRGVDVVLNSLSKDLLGESLECVARFGSFLEIGKYDITKKHDINLASFDKMIQFFSVDLTALAQYRPHVVRSLLAKVLERLDSGVYKLLHPIKTLPLSQIEAAFRQLKEGKFIGKIILEATREEKVIATPKRNSVSDYALSGTIVVAGGLGGLGLEVARHLARHGAQHIALLSRRALAVTESETLHNEFRALGAKIYLVQCNIADPKCKTTLREQLRTAPPVEIVLQSAMVTDDQSIEQMSLQQFYKTHPSKIDGSRNLLTTFDGPHLKHMVMFSSCAGTFGGMRASNYAAANAAQDAFAVDQEHGTVRVTTIDLGPIKDVGVLAEQSNLVHKIAAQGFVAWGMEDVFALLDSLLDPKSLKQAPEQLLVGFTKDSMAGAHHTHNINNPILKHVLQSKPTALGQDGNKSDIATTTLEIRASMENAADFQAATSVVQQHLANKICSLSAVELDAMTDENPLSDFGLDSLILMELKNWISRTFTASLQTTNISDAPNLTSLSEMIANRSKLFKQPAPIDSEDISSESQSDSENEHSSVTDLSREEVEFPKQPLPGLEESVEQYLEEVKNICSPAELDETRAKALDLVRSSGSKYYAQLRKAAEDRVVENWFSDLYAKGNFLRERHALIGRSSFFAYQSTSKGYDPVDVAAMLTKATFAYKEKLETGQNSTCYLRDRQIDMSAEHSIFNALREPRLGEDRMVKHESHDYIVVLRRGYAFQVTPQVCGSQLSAEDLSATFRAILETPLETRSNLAALTADGRDDWAKYRDHLRALSETNAASLQTIEAAAFVVCFDETTPEGPGSRASQFFCGDGQTNRWYDKTLQFIICPDGSAASLVGHTLLDGTSVGPLREFILPKLQEWLKNPLPSTSTPPIDPCVHFSPLRFDTDEHISQRVDHVQVAMAELQDASSFDSFTLPDMGDHFWRTQRISPKSGLQVLIQLAVHMYYGANVPSMETVSLARYRRGRSALTSIVSPQVKAFCTAAVRYTEDDGEAKKARALFLDAVNGHNAGLVRASAGKLPRSNLTALKWTAEDMGDTPPAFFADPAWERYSHEQVTVDCLDSDFEECGLLQHEDRIWVHFQPQPHRALFSVCARPRDAAKDFRLCVENAASRVVKILGRKEP